MNDEHCVNVRNVHLEDVNFRHSISKCSSIIILFQILTYKIREAKFCENSQLDELFFVNK